MDSWLSKQVLWPQLDFQPDLINCGGLLSFPYTTVTSDVQWFAEQLSYSVGSDYIGANLQRIISGGKKSLKWHCLFLVRGGERVDSWLLSSCFLRMLIDTINWSRPSQILCKWRRDLRWNMTWRRDYNGIIMTTWLILSTMVYSILNYYITWYNDSRWILAM